MLEAEFYPYPIFEQLYFLNIPTININNIKHAINWLWDYCIICYNM